MSNSDMHTMKRSRSEPADGTAPPLKFSSAQVRLKGRAWNKSPLYYFQDGSLLLLVDATAYCVQGSILFAHSPYWREVLGNEAKNEYAPQELHGIQRWEMDAFLSVIYPRSFERYDTNTSEHWAAVLRLSSLWNMESLRNLALSKLDAVATPLCKLVLARALDIPDWVEPAFNALACRAEPLSLEEASALSMEDVLRISGARENVLKLQAAEQSTAATCTRPHNSSRALARRDSKSSSGSSRTAAPPSKPSLPEATIPFSRKELGRLSTALSDGHMFDDVLGMVTPDKIPAFCHALSDFSDLLSPNAFHNSSFSHSIFKRAATKPSFIPVAVKLASIITVHNEHASSACTFSNRLFGLRRCLQDDVNGLRSLWASVNQAKIKYPDFSLAYKSGARGHYFSEGLLGFDCGSKPPREREYEERSANLRAFIAALAADNVRLVK
ncbi:hypothetical protein PENSPDRAFT_607113 [Peniophora sp. CONT]|nr:hypothetical protein PENSPDRAFT_607113 [Peniophora sp. CONT]